MSGHLQHPEVGAPGAPGPAGLASPASPASHSVFDATFDAVLFDLDGTLISSVGSVERSWARLAAELAIPADRFGDFHGIPARSLLDILLHDRPVADRDAAMVRIEQLEVEDAEGIEVLPGAREALDRLLAAGRCAIVTSCTRRLADARLAATGLARPPMVTSDDVVRGKPDPEPYLAGAALLGVDPARCLVVEDATAGLTAGVAAGMATLAVATTHAAEALRADLVVRDLGDVDVVVGEGGVQVVLRVNPPGGSRRGEALEVPR